MLSAKRSSRRIGPLNVLPFACARKETVEWPRKVMPPSAPAHAGSCRNWMRKSTPALSSPAFSHSVKSKIAPPAPM